MRKRKELSPEEKHQKTMEKYSPIYTKIYEELKFEGLTTVEMIHKLVDNACELQHEICRLADSIKIDGLDEAKQILTIDKGTWNEFVSITAKKMYGKYSEKAVEKFEQKVEDSRYKSNLHQAFLDSYLSDEDIKIVDESEHSSYDYKDISEDDFGKLLEKHAKTRDYINNVLYSRYDELKKAAYFITDGQLQLKDFKDLVDWEVYKESEDPKYKDKAWLIYKPFARMFRIMTEFCYEDHLNDLAYEFGINGVLGTPHEVTKSWDSQID